jgi:hypothetical protein
MTLPSDRKLARQRGVPLQRRSLPATYGCDLGCPRVKRPAPTPRVVELGLGHLCPDILRAAR